MCNLYSITTNQAAIIALLRLTGCPSGEDRAAARGLAFVVIDRSRYSLKDQVN
jgi:hypothetical protein